MTRAFLLFVLILTMAGCIGDTYWLDMSQQPLCTPGDAPFITDGGYLSVEESGSRTSW